MEPSTGASNVPFPIKLRAMLAETEAKGLSHIVSWEMEGTAFRVHDPEEFVKQIMRQWFNQTKYKSFQRQLNLYGFNRVSRGPQKGCYVHDKFQRDQPEWTESICRKRVSDEDFTEAELMAPAWLPDATRSVLEPTPIRDTTTGTTPTKQPQKAVMMEAFESYFQTEVVVKGTSRPTIKKSIKSHASKDSSQGTCSGNALQRFLDQALETNEGSAGTANKPHAVVPDDETDSKDDTAIIPTNFFHKRSPRCAVFPDKLHDMLDYCETNCLSRICCWEMEGRAFRIRSIHLFTEQVMPKFFKLTKFESLQRQLNLYSFTRIARGPMKGCYYHPLFVRGGRDLSKDMQRRKPDDGAISSIASPEICKSSLKKQRISISENNNNNNKIHEGESSSGNCNGDGTSTRPFTTTVSCSSAVSDPSEDELEIMARDCFDSQSNSGASIIQSESSYNHQLSDATAMEMAMRVAGVSRTVAPAVSPQGMVMSAGWNYPVLTGNHTTMNRGDGAFNLASQASLW